MEPAIKQPLLKYKEQRWAITDRLAAWSSLGPMIFETDLDRFREIAVRVLKEKDPQFELPSDDRPAANLYGKVFSHSENLRKGLAETLALLGSNPQALTSCVMGKAESTAILSVREIFKDADWVLWASLHDQLSLLAEAAPEEFLNALEVALNANPSPVESLFSQESSGVFSRNQMTGILWALETLAWADEYCGRVIAILGELAARDPGGGSSNRPGNSIVTILMPWFPQTCASIDKRKAAVEGLRREFPILTWRLILALLPDSHQMSVGSAKPRWRKFIQDNWSEKVKNSEYYEQIEIYAHMAVEMAKNDVSKLIELIDHLSGLTEKTFTLLLGYLSTNDIIDLPEKDRLSLWTRLTDTINKHKKYKSAEWAMKPEILNRIGCGYFR